MGAITDILQSLQVTPGTPEKKPCNQLQAAPFLAVTQVTPVTPKKTTNKAETAKRQVLTFAIDGTPRPITAIDTMAATRAEALERLRYAWGPRLDCVWSADGRLMWQRGCT